MSSSQIDNVRETIGNMVRSWLHFDQLAATFQRQTQQARTARARWEEQIINHLSENKMKNAIIQTDKGSLTLHEEKHAQALTLQRLEALLHEYYDKKPMGSNDETDLIMKYIKENRGIVTETKIKRI